VHTKIMPQAFPIVHLFTAPTIESGPNGSTAVDQKGGVSSILWAGIGDPQLLCLSSADEAGSLHSPGLRADPGDAHMGPAPHDHGVCHRTAGQGGAVPKDHQDGYAHNCFAWLGWPLE
jgi:hypothetical protein